MSALAGRRRCGGSVATQRIEDDNRRLRNKDDDISRQSYNFGVTVIGRWKSTV